jgi:hypothetical protein
MIQFQPHSLMLQQKTAAQEEEEWYRQMAAFDEMNVAVLRHRCC